MKEGEKGKKKSLKVTPIQDPAAAKDQAEWRAANRRPQATQTSIFGPSQKKVE